MTRLVAGRQLAFLTGSAVYYRGGAGNGQLPAPGHGRRRRLRPGLCGLQHSHRHDDRLDAHHRRRSARPPAVPTSPRTLRLGGGHQLVAGRSGRRLRRRRQHDDRQPDLRDDELAPTASATFPSAPAYNTAGWTGSLTGTAADAGSGVNAVKVSIQDTTVGGSSCWNGATFTAACPNYVAAAGTTSWSYALAAGALTNAHNYTATVETIDNVTNTNTAATTATWNYDTSAPSTATLTSNGNYNTAGWPGAITGTTNDSATGAHGISAVNVSIQDSTTGKCWNGTNFTTATCPNYVAVTSGGSAAGAANANWSYTLASGALTNGDTYTVQVQATDATTSGTQSGNLAAGTFTYDTSAPTTAALTTNGVYNAAGWPGAISGTTNDSATVAHGISAVSVSVQDSTTGKCWNGTNFTTAACPNYVAVTSGGSSAGAANASWSYTLASGALTDGDTYTVLTRATDATTSGNVSGNLTTGTFKYDTSPPVYASSATDRPGTHIDLTFTEATAGLNTGITPAASAFTVVVGGFGRHRHRRDDDRRDAHSADADHPRLRQ